MHAHSNRAAARVGRGRRLLRCLLLACALAGPGGAAHALDLSVRAIGADRSRDLLGDGTGVVVGVIDSGVDDTHPTLAGLDSLGRPRMVSEANFVSYEQRNTGDDVHGHGTWVASVIAGADTRYTGVAPDARFVNARVLDNDNGFPNDRQVREGVSFAINEGADVLNLSLNYFGTFSSGAGQLDYLIDWAAESLGVSSVICAGNISQASGQSATVRGPAGAYNGVAVGHTDRDFDQVNPNSANAFTQDRRMKPDLVAPGTSITMANDDWETQSDFTSASGCSFATPHVAGLMAQQIEAGRGAGLSTDPLVIKTTLMNSASKDVLDKRGDPWSAASSRLPLDTHSGAGQVDGVALAEQYLAGEQDPGVVPSVGWDLGAVTDGGSVDYVLDTHLLPGTHLTATLTWSRHIGRTDLGPSGLDASDRFFLEESVDNLDLQVLADGIVVAESDSRLDTVEHLWFAVDPGVDYTLRVQGTDIVGVDPDEAFALAWSAIAVPEPTAAAALAMLFGLVASRTARVT